MQENNTGGSEILAVLNEKAKRRIELDKLKGDLAAQEKILNEEIRDIERFIIQALEGSNMKGFDSEFGKFTLKVKSYAAIKDQDALCEWLKEKGIYDSLVSLNAAKMNKYYAEEEEKALAAGDIDFVVPGMEVTSAMTSLSITGKKTFKV